VLYTVKIDKKSNFPPEISPPMYTSLGSTELLTNADEKLVYVQLKFVEGLIRG